jgi:hypothetical protein
VNFRQFADLRKIRHAGVKVLWRRVAERFTRFIDASLINLLQLRIEFVLLGDAPGLGDLIGFAQEVVEFDEIVALRERFNDLVERGVDGARFAVPGLGH